MGVLATAEMSSGGGNRDSLPGQMPTGEPNLPQVPGRSPQWQPFPMHMGWGGTLLSPSELRGPWWHPVMDGRGVFCPSKGVSTSQGLFAGSDPGLTASIVVSSLASGSD